MEICPDASRTAHYVQVPLFKNWNKNQSWLVHAMQSNGPLQQVAVGKCSRSSYLYDDGRKQGGKSTATHLPEFQIVNKVAGGLYLVMWCAAALKNFQSPAKQEILIIFVYYLHDIDMRY
jgi:hypothetical protein